MGTRIHIIGLIGFLIVTGFGFAGLLSGPDEQLITTLEQTRIVSFPDFSHGINHDNLSQLESWCNQRVLGRSVLLRGFVRLYYALGQSAYPRQVISGRDGWLFVGSNFSNPTGKVLEISPVPGKRVDYYLSVASQLYTYCSANKIAFLYLLPPDKDAIYPEYLPYWAKYARPKNRIELLLGQKAAEKNLPVLDLTPAMLDAKNRLSVLLYQKQNSHWNFPGACVGYYAMMTDLKKQNSGLQMLQGGKIDTNAPLSSDDDLRKMLLRVPAKAKDDNWPVRFDSIDANQTYELAIDTSLEQQRTHAQTPGVLRQTNRVQDELFNPGNADIYVMTNPSALNKNRLLLVGDSFSERMNPYLIATFNEVIRVNRNIFDNNNTQTIIWLVNRFHPDTVVTESVARGL